jgi:hypothetical protein
MVALIMREDLKYIPMVNGEEFVVKSGVQLNLMFYAEALDILGKYLIIYTN